jgi:hypothetical protein
MKQIIKFAYEKRKIVPLPFSWSEVDAVDVEAVLRRIKRGKDKDTIRTLAEDGSECSRDGHEVGRVPVRLVAMEWGSNEYL